jgi:hypothetical protein
MKYGSKNEDYTPQKGSILLQIPDHSKKQQKTIGMDVILSSPFQNCILMAYLTERMAPKFAAAEIERPGAGVHCGTAGSGGRLFWGIVP